MLVAVTGTPGTGKTSACDALAHRGYLVVDLDDVARRGGFITGRDEVRGSDEVDVDALRENLQVPAKVAFVRSHYAHHMAVDLVVVLRCAPSVLRKRLEARGWAPAKIQENLEAEAIDVITQEAVELHPAVYEIDTTRRTAEDTAQTILEILRGKTQGHEPGTVNWADEVLSWY